MCGHRYHQREMSEWSRPERVERRPDPALRASSADRDLVLEKLRVHVGTGRLDLDEFGDRVDQALEAKTMGELSLVLQDLPPVTTPAEAAAQEARRRAGLRAELFPYLAVMTLLLVIWALTTAPGYFWPIWPMLGWGIPLFLGLRHHVRPRPRQTIPA